MFEGVLVIIEIKVFETMKGMRVLLVLIEIKMIEALEGLRVLRV